MAPKRKQRSSQGTEAERDGKENDPQTMTFEQRRQQILARNRALLMQIGLPQAAKQFSNALSREQLKTSGNVGASQHKKRAPKTAHAGGGGPVRRSVRNQIKEEQERELTVRGIARDSDAGHIYLYGTCPKCGQAVDNVAYKEHLEGCKGPPERPKYVSRPSGRSMEERMKELGPVEILEGTSLEIACFQVIGSTGKHYKVELSAEKRKCQCVDHRIRRHDCKHINLVLHFLGVRDTPDKWQEGLMQLKMDEEGVPEVGQTFVLDQDTLKEEEPEEGLESPPQKAIKAEPHPAVAFM